MLRDLPCDFVMCKREALCDLCLVWSACGWIGNDLRSVWRWWIRPLSAPSSLESKGKKRTIQNSPKEEEEEEKEFVDFQPGTMAWIWWHTISLPNCLTVYTFLSSSSLFISRLVTHLFLQIVVSVLRADNREISGLIGKENQVAHTTSSTQIIRTCVFCFVFYITDTLFFFFCQWLDESRPTDSQII